MNLKIHFIRTQTNNYINRKPLARCLPEFYPEITLVSTRQGQALYSKTAAEAQEEQAESTANPILLATSSLFKATKQLKSPNYHILEKTQLAVQFPSPFAF